MLIPLHVDSIRLAMSNDSDNNNNNLMIISTAAKTKRNKKKKKTIKEKGELSWATRQQHGRGDGPLLPRYYSFIFFQALYLPSPY